MSEPNQPEIPISKHLGKNKIIQSCEHSLKKCQCQECRGSAHCEHGRYKSRCKECGGSEINFEW